MEKIGMTFYVWILLWLISGYLAICESLNNNTSEIITAIREYPKFIYVSLTLCHCNSGQVMGLSGQCLPYEKGTTVPTLSHPGSEIEFIDTREFDVWVNTTLCVQPQVHLSEDEFVLWVSDDNSGLLQVIEGPYRGLKITDYCVHHQWEQGRVKVTLQGCISVPVVPRCCHMGNDGCANETSTPLGFNPPLAIGMQPDGQVLSGLPFPWDFFTEHVEKPNCDSENTLKKFELDGQKSLLVRRQTMVWFTWQLEGFVRQFYYPPNYCVDLVEEENKYFAYICKKITFKCCQVEEIFSLDTGDCVRSDPALTIFNFSTTFSGYPICTNGNPEGRYLTNIAGKITLNGSLIHEDVTYPSDKYCTETLVKGSSTVLGALVCIPEMSYHQIMQREIYPWFKSLSCGFLALLLLLHAWIPKLREKEGKYQLFHALSLLIAFTLQLMFNELQPHGYTFSGACVPLAFVMQFSFLSSFFWLNAMCFDVLRLFRKLVKCICSPYSSVPLWKMMLYAFGGPSIITLITIIVQFVAPKDGSLSSLYHPRIGENKCWFLDFRRSVLYFFAPISLLFVLNIIFIGQTYFCLKIIEKALTSNDKTGIDPKKRETDCVSVFWQQYKLLFLLTGLWMGETLGYFIPPEELWIPTDILNNLQGVLIFFVFLMNDKKRDLLKKQLPKLLEYTNIWIDETDAAQEDITTHNLGLSKSKSPLHFMTAITSTTSFNLNENEKSANRTTSGIISLSIVKCE